MIRDVLYGTAIAAVILFVGLVLCPGDACAQVVCYRSGNTVECYDTGYEQRLRDQEARERAQESRWRSDQLDREGERLDREDERRRRRQLRDLLDD